MKTPIKITVIAALAAFAVFSCGPEAELSGVNWKEVNTKYNTGKNSDYDGIMYSLQGEFAIDGFLSTEADAANELDITFPGISDFLRTSSEAKIESGLRQFLSFHHFTEATELGKIDTLGPALGYNYIKRNGNVITVKLTKTFVEADSSVIL
jgi:hypothetical protein